VSELLVLAEELGKLTSHNRLLYLKTEPEIQNFTKPFTGKIQIYGEKANLIIPVQGCDISNLFHQLRGTLFTPEMTVIFWNVKNLISYFRFHLPRTAITIDAKWFDLKLIEGFFGTKLSAPVSLKESLHRLEPYLKSDECKKLHKHIHKPLALRVIPEMETATTVIDTEFKKYLYSSYEIEAQTTGRMSSHKSFDNCVVPHNMGDDQKNRMKLCDDKDFFVYFDFKHMEVSVLQWLSDDAALKNILSENEDLYKGIYKKIIGQSCDTDDKRELIKGMFLPVMFGLQPSGLVEKMAEEGITISLSSASQVHLLIRQNFKTAWDYLSEYQERVKFTPIISDFFGRSRSFVDKPWSVRGFIVQAASSVVCMEKLIELHSALGDCGKMLYSIHDGYVVVANEQKLNKIIGIGLKALQGASQMCPNLQLKVSCSIGIRLSHMKPLPGMKEKNGNGG
jgi:hypothetical protein